MGWFEVLFGALARKNPEWDLSERRKAFRAPCDFEIEMQGPGCSYLARVLDAGPQGLRLRIRGPWDRKLLKRGQPVRLRHTQLLYEAELDTVEAGILWVKREGEQLFTLAVAFQEDLDRLKRSWVKPVLQKVFKTASRRNQRRHLRVRCQLPARIEWEGLNFEVKMTDLSTSGARVSSLRAIPQGEILTVEFQQLRLRAWVRRVHEDLGICRLGLQFQIDDSVRKRLMSLVKQLTAVGKLIDT